MSLKNIALLLLVILITTGAFIFYYFQQPEITYENCRLCDGNQYLKMYDYFEGNTPEYKVSFPYYSRTLVPFLASFVSGNNAIWSFHLVNGLFSILGAAIIYMLWRKLQISWYLIVIGLVWLLFHWTGMIRLNVFDPLTIDVPLYALQVFLIFIFMNKKFKWLLILAPVAVLQKESIIPVLMVFLLFVIFYNKVFQEEKISLRDIILALVLAILTKFVFTLFFPPSQEGYSSVRLALFYCKEIVMDHFRILRWITGVFMAYGAFLLVAFMNIRKKYFTDPFVSFLSVMSALSILLSVIGGQDHTRIAFLGFPFVMTWILLMLKESDWKLVLSAALFSFPLMRIFEKIPDPGKDFFTFTTWYPEYAASPIVVGLTGFICLTIVVFIGVNLLITVKR